MLPVVATLTSAALATMPPQEMHCLTSYRVVADAPSPHMSKIPVIVSEQALAPVAMSQRRGGHTAGAEGSAAIPFGYVIPTLSATPRHSLLNYGVRVID